MAILDQALRGYDRPALFVDRHAPEVDLATLPPSGSLTPAEFEPLLEALAS